ncbi:GNAT family N-acetyltransferase [Erythrobacter arachoides]|uniref:GNAT family N-acetyltransferase n=2 Tax=Aurantiacibacter arachoides TaxID=1850444 RepID=A0A844ZYD2_9SPHN|nr:GNAT family N-acetyltransferase [Aurantiacibacter arachoides]MXO92252.1 GNAT family N-acetyltransferase [Aurantiacibacter arachoides]GGD58528.1 N-acetyltransferase [Aurantiacibacter arachoides]
MILRPALLADAEPLARLGRISFCAAFAHLYRPQDLAAFLEEVYSVDAVATEIADPTITHRLVEDDDGGPLTGFIKMRSPSWYADHSDAARPIALGQLYTDPARTGEGIGAALMDWALDFARSGGHDAVQLSVWAENHAAQRFYARYGFIKIADIHFPVGEQLDEEFLLELRI